MTKAELTRELQALQRIEARLLDAQEDVKLLQTTNVMDVRIEKIRLEVKWRAANVRRLIRDSKE